MWFEPRFDKDLKAFISSNPLPLATLCCFTESFRYAERFIDAGFSPLLYEGLYLGDGHPDEHYSPEHYWLFIRGRFFDPTSAQFKSELRSDFYELTTIWNIPKIVNNLPYVERPEQFVGNAEQQDWSRSMREACGIRLV
jgi:hypothetical protein